MPRRGRNKPHLCRQSRLQSLRRSIPALNFFPNGFRTRDELGLHATKRQSASHKALRSSVPALRATRNAHDSFGSIETVGPQGDDLFVGRERTGEIPDTGF